MVPYGPRSRRRSPGRSGCTRAEPNARPLQNTRERDVRNPEGAVTDTHPLVFRTNMDAGHGGASGRFDRLQETAFATAFALKVVGKA